MNQFQMVPRSASKLMGKLFPRSAVNGVQWNWIKLHTEAASAGVLEISCSEKLGKPIKK